MSKEQNVFILYFNSLEVKIYKFWYEHIICQHDINRCVIHNQLKFTLYTLISITTTLYMYMYKPRSCWRIWSKLAALYYHVL